MDSTNMQFRAVVVLSSAVQTFQRADAIISLAETNPKHAQTLAGCVTIILAAALDQGVKTVLTGDAENDVADSLLSGEEIQVTETDAGMLYEDKSWDRVKSLPSVLTDGRFQLDENHSLSRYLQALVKTRNKLVHIDEPAVHLVSDDPSLKIEDNRAVIGPIPLPENAWNSVTLEKARGFREAVDAYFREVLFPESGEITHGTIVISALPR